MNGYRMPAESAPQDRAWMALPSEGYSLGDTDQAIGATANPAPMRAALINSSRRVRTGP